MPAQGDDRFVAESTVRDRGEGAVMGSAAMQRQSRDIERKQAIDDVRKGALLIVGFLALSVVLAKATSSGTIIAIFPIVVGAILLVRGALGLAKTSGTADRT